MNLKIMKFRNRKPVVLNRDLFLYNAFKREFKHTSSYRKEIESTPDNRFYSIILIIPSCVIFPLLIGLLALIKDDYTAFSIFAGIFGSYVASVVVTWLIEYNNCKHTTIDRLKRQDQFFSELVGWCAWYYNRQACLINKTNNGRNLALDEATCLIRNYISEQEKIGNNELSCEQREEFIEAKSKYLFSLIISDGRMNWVPDIVDKYKRYSDSAQYSNQIYSYDKSVIRYLCELIEKIYHDYLNNDYVNMWNDNDLLLKKLKEISNMVLPFVILNKKYFT